MLVRLGLLDPSTEKNPSYFKDLSPAMPRNTKHALFLVVPLVAVTTRKTTKFKDMAT